MKAQIPLTTIQAAFVRSQGRCECTETKHNHPYLRCPYAVTWEQRGKNGKGSWEIYNQSGDKDTPTPDDCLVLCTYCYERTNP